MQPSRRATDPPPSLDTPDPAHSRLSARELEVALLIGEGLKDVVVARLLAISVSTVRALVRRMRFRLGLTSRAAVVDWVAARHTPGQPEAALRRAGATRTSMDFDPVADDGPGPVIPDVPARRSARE